MHKYGESKTTRIMMATVPHVTAWAGRTKYQADGFLFDGVYIRCRGQISGYKQIQACVGRIVLRVQLIVNKYFLETRLGCFSVLMRNRVSFSHQSRRSCSYDILTVWRLTTHIWVVPHR